MKGMGEDCETSDPEKVELELKRQSWEQQSTKQTESPPRPCLSVSLPHTLQMQTPGRADS